MPAVLINRLEPVPSYNFLPPSPLPTVGLAETKLKLAQEIQRFC